MEESQFGLEVKPRLKLSVLWLVRLADSGADERGLGWMPLRRLAQGGLHLERHIRLSAARPFHACTLANWVPPTADSVHSRQVVFI